LYRHRDCALPNFEIISGCIHLFPPAMLCIRLLIDEIGEAVTGKIQQYADS
jgi:hypothetical protein